MNCMPMKIITKFTNTLNHPFLCFTKACLSETIFKTRCFFVQACILFEKARFLPMNHILAYVPNMYLVEDPDNGAYQHLATTDQEQPDSIISKAGVKEKYAPHNKPKSNQKIVDYMYPLVGFMGSALVFRGYHGIPPARVCGLQRYRNQNH